MAKLKVFYDYRQSSPKAVASPSATKPALLAKRWQEKYFNQVELASFQPVKVEDFYLAHARQHVDDVLNCKKPNGFEDSSPLVAATFPWTTGSMLAAAQEALNSKTFTCSLTSGFHHAGYATCRGYCTFNGLVVTAVKLLQAGVKKVGIVDCDVHYGDGTEELIEHHILYEQVRHYTLGAEDRNQFYWTGNPVWGGDARAEAWLNRFPEILAKFQDCQIILYQAGADVHVEDPYGGALTTDQMIRRDRWVFQAFKKLGIPLAWNLAGGYQTPIEKVLQLHDNTLEACLENL